MMTRKSKLASLAFPVKLKLKLVAEPQIYLGVPLVVQSPSETQASRVSLLVPARNPPQEVFPTLVPAQELSLSASGPVPLGEWLLYATGASFIRNPAGNALVPNQLVWLLVTLSWSDTTWFPVFLRSMDSLLQLKLTQQVLSNPSFGAPTRLELVLTCMVQLLQEPSTYPEPHSMVEDCHAMAVWDAIRRVTFPVSASLVARPVET